MSLAQAHLQQRYRTISLVFIALVVLVLGGLGYTGWSRTTITVFPKTTPVKTDLTLTISPDGEGPNGLAGDVTVSQESATVSAQPNDQGEAVPAHARGQVTIHNDSSASQPLATNTRLQSTGGVIVRTVDRVDVPAHGTIQIEAVADPLGPEGEIEPGRLTIVALRPANQALVYGTTDQVFTGGTTTAAGVLGSQGLNQASNQAQQKILDRVGASSAGTFRTVQPVSVSADPDPDTPSDQYTITVEAKVITATFDQSALDALIRQRLTDALADGQIIVSVDPIKLTFVEQPALDSLTISVTGTATASLSPKNPILQPSRFTSLSQEDITKRLLGSQQVDRVLVKIAPWWRTATSAQADRITVRLETPQDPAPGKQNSNSSS